MDYSFKEEKSGETYVNWATGKYKKSTSKFRHPNTTPVILTAYTFIFNTWNQQQQSEGSGEIGKCDQRE